MSPHDKHDMHNYWQYQTCACRFMSLGKGDVWWSFGVLLDGPDCKQRTLSARTICYGYLEDRTLHQELLTWTTPTCTAEGLYNGHPRDRRKVPL